MTAFNRALWTVIGAALALAGIAGLLGHFGWLPGVSSSDLLAPTRVPGVTERPAPWPAVAGIAIGVALVLLGLLLLWVQRPHRRDGRPALTLPAEEPAGPEPGRPVPPGAATGGPVHGGRTRVEPAVLDRALRRDLRRDHRLHHVRVHVTWDKPSRTRQAADRDGPEVALHLETGPDDDLNPVRDEVQGAVRRLGSTMSVRPRLTRVEVGQTRTPGRTTL